MQQTLVWVCPHLLRVCCACCLAAHLQRRLLARKLALQLADTALEALGSGLQLTQPLAGSLPLRPALVARLDQLVLRPLLPPARGILATLPQRPVSPSPPAATRQALSGRCLEPELTFRPSIHDAACVQGAP